MIVIKNMWFAESMLKRLGLSFLVVLIVLSTQSFTSVHSSQPAAPQTPVKLYSQKSQEQFWQYVKKTNKLKNSRKFSTIRFGISTCNALRGGATLMDLAMAIGPEVLLQDRKAMREIAAAGRFLCPDQSSKFR
jgi:hypothetical protein